MTASESAFEMPLADASRAWGTHRENLIRWIGRGLIRGRQAHGRLWLVDRRDERKARELALQRRRRRQSPGDKAARQ
jgi:hypothetical protein